MRPGLYIVWQPELPNRLKLGSTLQLGRRKFDSCYTTMFTELPLYKALFDIPSANEETPHHKSAEDCAHYMLRPWRATYNLYCGVETYEPRDGETIDDLLFIMQGICHIAVNLIKIDYTFTIFGMNDDDDGVPDRCVEKTYTVPDAIKQVISTTTMRDIVAAAAQTADITNIDDITDADDDDDIIDVENIRQPSKQLRQYQSDAIARVAAVAPTHKIMRVIMACGTGKTLTMLHQFLNTYRQLPPSVCVFAVPSLFLLSQTFKEWSSEISIMRFNASFVLVGSDIDSTACPDADIKAMLTTDPDRIARATVKYLHSGRHVVIITTYQSSERLAQVPQPVPLVVMDECHNAAGANDAKKSKWLLKDKNFKATLRVLVTATDKRSMREDEKQYGKIVYKYTMRDAIDDDYLTDYRILYAVTNNNAVIPSPDNDDYVTATGVDLMATAAALVKTLGKFPIKKMITYSNRNADAYKLHKLLAFNTDVAIFYIDGSMNAKRRAAVVAEFLSSKRSVLCNVKVLAEGADIPPADAIAFCDNKDSTVDIIQMTGRGLRKHASKELCYVVVPCVYDANAESCVKDKDVAFTKARKISKTLMAMDDLMKSEIISSARSKTKCGRILCVGNDDDRDISEYIGKLDIAVITDAAAKAVDVDNDKYALMINVNPKYHDWRKAFTTINAVIESKQTLKKYVDLREIPVLYKGNSPLGVIGMGKVISASNPRPSYADAAFLTREGRASKEQEAANGHDLFITTSVQIFKEGTAAIHRKTLATSTFYNSIRAFRCTTSWLTKDQYEELLRLVVPATVKSIEDNAFTIGEIPGGRSYG